MPPAVPRRSNPRLRRALAAVLLLVLGVLGQMAPGAQEVEADLTGTPQNECGPGSDPEGDIQGRVPAEDYDTGRVDRPYTCNTERIGHHGATGGFKVLRYVDAQGQECAYYDSTLLLPTDLLTQASTGTGVIVLDMSDPTNPVTTTTLTTPAMLSPHESLDLNQARGLLAAVTGTAATYPGVVDVYDVSADCTQPVLQASAPVGFLGHESGFAPDGLTFYTASTVADSIVAIDLTDPTTPTPVAFIPSQSHGITVSDDGNRLYTTVLDIEDPLPLLPTTGELIGGIGILDVSAIQAREPLPQAITLSELSWPESSIPQTAIPVTIDGTPYLVEIDEFVSFRDAYNPISGTPGAGHIIDISDETNPVLVSRFRLDVHDPAIRASDAGLASDPGQSYGPGSFGQGYGGHYCAVPQQTDPGIVACSMIMSGLRVFDIRDPHNPVEIAYFNTVTPTGNPASSGGAYAMSAPAFVPERGEIWYSDVNSGFHVVRVTNGVWPFPDTAEVQRLAGPTRVETAVEASRASFADGAADAVVLARADDFADALAGGPLAVRAGGPVLLSGSDALPPATAAEIERVLGADGTVYLLGGTAALSTNVADVVRAAGHEPVRLGGATRFETAAVVARDGLGGPDEVVVADGTTFADAVVAAPVAGASGAALLLSEGGVLPEATADYLADHPGATVTTIGAAASGAVTDPAATRVDGSATGDLGVDVAAAFFVDADTVGIARDDVFADALTAGAVLGADAGPVLLVAPDTVPDVVAAHLAATSDRLRLVRLFGGTAALSDAVADRVQQIIDGSGGR